MDFYTEHRDILPFFFLRTISTNYFKGLKALEEKYTEVQKLENSFLFESDFHLSHTIDLHWKNSSIELAIKQQCNFVLEKLLSLDKKAFLHFIDFQFTEKLKSAYDSDKDKIFEYQSVLILHIWSCGKEKKKILTKEQNFNITLLRNWLTKHSKDYKLEERWLDVGEYPGLIKKVFTPFEIVTLKEDYRICVKEVETNFLNYMRKLYFTPTTSNRIEGKLFEDEAALNEFIQTYFKIKNPEVKPPKGFRYSVDNCFKGDVIHFFYVLYTQVLNDSKLNHKMEEILFSAFPKFNFTKNHFQSNFAKTKGKKYPEHWEVHYRLL